jgi:acetoin utilization protein AcuC
MVGMAENDVYVVWDETVTGYNFGPSHPMHPFRLDLTAKLALDFGLFDAENVHVHPINEIDEAKLARLHDADFIAAVKQAGTPEGLSEEDADRYGIGTEDVPGFENMHTASALLFQGSIDAADAIISGGYRRAVNFCGGMHHCDAGQGQRVLRVQRCRRRNHRIPRRRLRAHRLPRPRRPPR